jgi:uncharacterized membrane protein
MCSLPPHHTAPTREPKLVVPLMARCSRASTLVVVKHLVVLAFVDEHRAAEVLAMLRRLNAGCAFQDENAACVVRATDWNVTLTHATHLARRDDTPRQFWRGLVASLVLAPGTADCRVSGQDYGIAPEFEAELRAALPPGSSAIFLVVSALTLTHVLPELHRCGGTLLQTPIDVGRWDLGMPMLELNPMARHG